MLLDAMSQPLTVPPGDPIRLADFDPSYHEMGTDKASSKDELCNNAVASAELAYRLYAENRRSLLIVLQGMDTAGKDGTIRNVMHGINPQSCQVTPFKQPSLLELDHDFLWRVHLAVPRKGNIGLFNRSHYEDVIVVRVHKLVPRSEWRTRYKQINLFEKLLMGGGMTILKCFLHISKEEQRERLQARLDDPLKRWKFSRRDLDERKRWDEYMAAYEDALTKCNTREAPWHIIPADRKWYRNLIVSRLLLRALQHLDPRYPPAEEELEGVVVE